MKRKSDESANDRGEQRKAMKAFTKSQPGAGIIIKQPCCVYLTGDGYVFTSQEGQLLLSYTRDGLYINPDGVRLLTLSNKLDSKRSLDASPAGASSTGAEHTTTEQRLGASFRTSLYETYTPLASPKQVGSYLNFIGVVDSATAPHLTETYGTNVPPMSQMALNQENLGWTTSIRLVDPSTTPKRPKSVDGFSINMFSNGHRERLPPVEKGHILILRQIEVVNYDNTLMGTGYADKFQWAIYDPKTKEIHHGESLEADTAEPTHPAPSPFFHPSFEDRAYCEELAGWKQALPKSSEAVRREHRLICDAGPNVPPQGYFDCTVEVLHVEENENGIISLYVTDYTSNPKVCPRWADWCPKALSADKVLRIEMRDDAAKVGVTMNKGEYYTIKNARMIDSSGYLEAKAREKKTRPAYKQDLGEACARRLGSVRVERDVGRNGGATNV